MSYKFKDIDIRHRTYYFFDDIINVKNFDPNKIKIDEKSYKNILIYFIGYAKINDSKYLKINSVKPLCLTISKVNRYFEEINKSKYLSQLPLNKTIEIYSMIFFFCEYFFSVFFFLALIFQFSKIRYRLQKTQ